MKWDKKSKLQRISSEKMQKTIKNYLSTYKSYRKRLFVFFCQGKTIDKLGKKTTIKKTERAERKIRNCPLVLESHGLELSLLKVKEVATNEVHTMEFYQLSGNDADQEYLETLLYFMDRFWQVTKVLFDKTEEE